MANLNDFQEQLDILSATKTSIKEAIIGKGQEVSSEDSFSSYADKIDDIVTLDEGTLDANANADDILLNKTAYVNGQKVTGTLEIADAVSIDNSNNTDTHLTSIDVDNISSMVVGADINDLYGVKKVVEDGVGLEIIAPQSQFADVIGLTADKIKQGEIILGITGNVIELNGETKTITPTTSQQVITPSQDKNAITEVTVNAVTSAIDSNIQAENIKNGVTILGITGTAQVIKEYSTYQEIEQALLDGDIETGDVVLCGGTYTFYLCEMNTETGDSYLEKLVKESETISPQEYEENVNLADDILGTE